MFGRQFSARLSHCALRDLVSGAGIASRRRVICKYTRDVSSRIAEERNRETLTEIRYRGEEGRLGYTRSPGIRGMSDCCLLL